MTSLPTASARPDVDVVRIRLGRERSVPQPDPLGNQMVGYRPGLTPEELWSRGRGLWKAKLEKVAAADLVVLTEGESDRVVLVGTIEGVRFHDERVAIEGRPLPQHPLIGDPDPVPNRSRNPIAYGSIETVPSTAFAREARPYSEVLADAISVLTEAARLRRHTMRATPEGSWEADRDRSEPADWAEFITLALAGAAANVGGIENALAGRPGSWEAARVRDTLVSTVGEDEASLWEHRTEPLQLVLDPDMGWLEELYEASRNHLSDLEEAAREPFAGLQHRWSYTRPFGGEFTSADPSAPAWDDATLARHRDDLRALGAPESFVEGSPWEITVEVWVSKSDEDRAALVELYHQEEQAVASIEAQYEALEALARADRADYLMSLQTIAAEEAARRFPGVSVTFLDPETAPRLDGWNFHDFDSPEAQLVEHAEANATRPGDGRLPHERLGGNDQR